MKAATVLLMTLSLFLYCPVASSSDFEGSAPPIDQKATETSGKIDGDIPFEDSSTPIEREDTETIGEIDKGTSFEDSSTPIEREDMKSINQVNGY